MPARGWLRLQGRWALLRGHPARARRHFDALLQRWPDDAHALASRAHLAAGAGDWDAAAADLQQLLRHHPMQAAAWFNLGFVLESQQRHEEACTAFRQAVAQDPGLDRAWYGLGRQLRRLGRLEEAQAALDRQTALQPMCPHGWEELVRLHLDRQAPEAARQVLDHLRGFEPRAAARLAGECGLAP